MRSLDSLRAQARAFDAKQQAEGLPRQMTLCAEPRPAAGPEMSPVYQPSSGSAMLFVRREGLQPATGGLPDESGRTKPPRRGSEDKTMTNKTVPAPDGSHLCLGCTRAILAESPAVKSRYGWSHAECDANPAEADRIRAAEDARRAAARTPEIEMEDLRRAEPDTYRKLQREKFASEPMGNWGIPEVDDEA